MMKNPEINISNQPSGVSSTVIAAVWLAVGTFALGMSGIHFHHNADSVMSTMLSVYNWDLFYWEQNRFGMLVPLICVPIKDLWLNFYIQNLITIACGILCFPLAQRLIFRDQKVMRTAVVSFGTFVLTSSSYFQWGFFSTWSIHSTSLCLALASLILCERSSIVWTFVSLLLFLLSSWINSAISVMLMPLILGLGLVRWWCLDVKDEKKSVVIEVVKGAGIAGGGFVVSKILERIPPLEHRNTWLHLPDSGEWLSLLEKQLSGFLETVHPTWWIVCLAFMAAFGIFNGVKQRAWRELLCLGLVVLSTIFFAVLTAILFDGRWRYSLSNLVMVHIATVHLFMLYFSDLQKRFVIQKSMPAKLAIAAVFGLAPVLLKYGSLGPSRLTEGLYTGFGNLATEASDSGCTHLAGDYWSVWPSVFLINSSMRDSSHPVWALSHRALSTRHLWLPADQAEVLIGYPKEDLFGPKYAEWIGFPLKRVRATESLYLLANET